MNFNKREDLLPVFHIGKIKDKVWTGTEAHEIEITGTVRLVYDRDNPLPIGARVWLEAGPDCEIKVSK